MEAFIPVSTFCTKYCSPRGVSSVSPQKLPTTVYTQRRTNSVRQGNRSITRMTTSVTTDRIANKSYQLEEDEDALSCTSAIYLSSDGTLSIGKTDGPKPDRVSASWKYSDVDGEIILEIERHFGEDTTSPFSVKRVLRGHLDETRKNLEDLPVFSGAMYQYPADFSPQSEVGWFAMIVATDDLPSDDFDISKS